jgi:hypothetical protein
VETNKQIQQKKKLPSCCIAILALVGGMFSMMFFAAFLSLFTGGISDSDNIADNSSNIQIQQTTKKLEEKITPKKLDSTIEYAGILPVHQVALIEDTSPSWNIKRFTIYVVIDEPVSTSQLKQISRNIVEETKRLTIWDKNYHQYQFNALVIGFNDYEEFIGDSYTLGSVIYAPEGKLVKASTVMTGDYKNMSFDWDLLEKDWTKRPNEREVKIYKTQEELYWNTMDKNPHLRDITCPEKLRKIEDELWEKTKDKVAIKFNITSKQVGEIYTKVSSWTTSGRRVQ